MLLNSQGRQIELGKRIAAGGEGEVFALAKDPNTVAKIYHGIPSGEKINKLRCMVAGGSAELAKLACWPTDVVTEAATGRVRGFLMPSAAGGKEIHLLYSPKSRANEFVSVQWPFLIAAAANMARALGVVHRTGHVIGDVNHSSVMISPDATVRLIDCDSFQIKAGGRLFKCEVGVPESTPPELQRKPLHQVERTPNHDAFGLAVLIFELLFMGRHPFGGQFTGPAQPDLEDKIARFLFAYGPGAAGRGMKQPPYTLQLDGVTPRLASYFEAAFGPSGPSARPSAADWVGALDELRSQTRPCAANRAHVYYHKLTACPWCPIENKLGFSLFTVQFAPIPSNPAFNLSLVWDSIASVKAPTIVPALVPAQHLVPGTAGDEFAEAGRVRRIHLGWIAATSAATAAFAALWGADAILPLTMLLYALWRWGGHRNAWNAKRFDAQSRVRRLSSAYEQASSKYNHWADGRAFKEAYSELDSAKQTLLGLPALRDAKIAQLKSQAEVILRLQFLNQFQIRPGQIPGFGPSRCADLQYYNIDTAADIEWYRVQQVPGIGPNRAADLLAWRRDIESRFRFNPAALVKTAEYQRMESEFAQQRSKIESNLAGGRQRLMDLAAITERERQLLEPQTHTLAKDLSQATADLRALKWR